MSALRGIRVLDLTRLLPGPFATLVLSDMGATVDKVEDAGAGDYVRYVPPQIAGMSAAFHALNRGKRSLVLDLKNPAGVTAFKRLVKNYDVVIEQFRPGVLDRLGVSHEAILRQNPKLVICALTGYGQNGPLRDRAGHDVNYMARAGLMGLQGPADGPPQLPAFQLADVSGGMWCVIAILGALRERDATGMGAVLDIAMTDAVIPFATPTLSRLLGGEAPARGNETLTGGIAPYNTYTTKDGGAVTLGALEPKFLMSFCRGVGIEFDGRALAVGPHQAALKEQFAQVFATKTRDEWIAFAEEHDCCLEPVLRPDELFEDPQLRARQIFFERDVSGSPVRGYRTPVTPRDFVGNPAPASGEHSTVILQEAGFSDSEIAELRQSGAIV